jgi:thiamine pyrophosphokinase
MERPLFLLADGEKLPRKLRDRLRRGRYSVVVDGAAEIARKERWLPDLILGDFDSAKSSTLKYFTKRGVEILETPDQDYTDLEKALAWCALRDFRSIWVAQAWGRRVDHSLANLSFLKKFHAPHREILLFTAHESIRFVKNQKLQLCGPSGRGMAVIPFPKACVSSRGLQYEMKKTQLALGLRESVSNKAAKNMVELKVDGEALVLEEFRL